MPWLVEWLDSAIFRGTVYRFGASEPQFYGPGILASSLASYLPWGSTGIRTVYSLSAQWLAVPVLYRYVKTSAHKIFRGCGDQGSITSFPMMLTSNSGLCSSILCRTTHRVGVREKVKVCHFRVFLSVCLLHLIFSNIPTRFV